MDYLLQVIIAGIGFVALYFIGNPIRTFWKIRSEINEALIYYANADSPLLGPNHDRAKEARAVYRKLASRLMASTTEIALYRLWTKAWVLPSPNDIEKAKANLIGLSNSVGIAGEQLNNSRREDNIRQALRIRRNG